MGNISGIYSIRNNINNKIYIGSSVNIKIRWATHKRALNSKVHHCQHLQRAWVKYGEDAFSFEIQETVPLDKLLQIEQLYLKKYWDNGINCYNVCKIAGSFLGVKHSEATKMKLRIKKQGSNNKRSKLTEFQVNEIKKLLLENNLMIKTIAIKFNIDKTVISKMISGERWAHCFNDEERKIIKNFQSQNKHDRMVGKNNYMYGRIGSLNCNYGNHASNLKMKGTGNPMSKLNHEIVKIIKLLLASKEFTQKQIANVFNVGQTTIQAISSGKRWESSGETNVAKTKFYGIKRITE